ncbi:HAD family hydrolase [Kineococcus sp. NBC_00420]|uniref:HAD family hydrolase n=1 Tax=Kineococcus sp. NBC_00420 TaxID=2903564 RepID=UPI002E1A4CB1
MDVLLIDLDDTLIPDAAARDQAMSSTLAAFAATTRLPDVWRVVRGEWQASGLRSTPALVGVSSWEALWTDFRAAVPDLTTQLAGDDYQARVWNRILPEEDSAVVGASFRGTREQLVRTFDWAPAALSSWARTHDLWCVTNGSSWLQRRKLQLAGLGPTFRDVVISGEVGAEKSELRFHDEVASRSARLGVQPVAVIGDSATSDGALASALQVRYVQVAAGTDPSSDFHPPSR